MSGTEIRQHLLGLRPFVLVEFTGADQDNTGEVTELRTTVEFGGGIVESDHEDDLGYAEVLAMVLQAEGWSLTKPDGEAFE